MDKGLSKLIINMRPNSNFTCFVITSLFFKDKYEELLNPKIKESIEKAIASYATYYRNNER